MFRYNHDRSFNVSRNYEKNRKERLQNEWNDDVVSFDSYVKSYENACEHTYLKTAEVWWNFCQRLVDKYPNHLKMPEKKH